MQCAIGSLALQERYSLVSACTFLVSFFSGAVADDDTHVVFGLQGSLINKAFASDELEDAKGRFIEAHGRSMMRAILCGFAGTAPRSVVPNLIELLSTLLARCPADSRVWLQAILFAVSLCDPNHGLPELTLPIRYRRMILYPRKRTLQLRRGLLRPWLGM